MIDSDFASFITEQLRMIPGVTAQRMFDGHGLRSEGVFFGIINKGRVYFKTNNTTVDEYKKRGTKPFAPSKKQVLKNYYAVPPEVIDDIQQFTRLALEAIAIVDQSL